jgi:hypothetical protein
MVDNVTSRTKLILSEDLTIVGKFVKEHYYWSLISLIKNY